MPNPIILPVNPPAYPLYRQIIQRLAGDTDPQQGIVPALGNGANAIYPNFDTDGPSTDRGICPTPFLIVASMGRTTMRDGPNREERIAIEIHDDPDQGMQRWPGLYLRVIQWLSVKEFRPTPDALAKYRSGMYYISESPPEWLDERYQTNMIQIILGCLLTDSASMHGRPS